MSIVTDAYNKAKLQNPNLQLKDFVKTFDANAGPTPAPEAATPVTPTGIASFQRDPLRERATQKKLGISDVQLMQLQDNPVFKKRLYDMTYGDGAKNVPGYNELANAEQGIADVGTQMQDTRKNAPNAMLALEDSLRTKNDVGKQQMGESELFKKAGLEGFFVLDQSLAEQSKLMADRYGSFINALSRAGQYQTNSYIGLAGEYKTLTDQYNKKSEEMNSILQDVQKYNEAMDLADKQLEIFKAQENFKRSLEPTPQQKMDAKIKGYEYVDGEYVDENSFQAVYGTIGNKKNADFDQCGHFSNNATTGGKKVGDSWASKIGTADMIIRQSSAGYQPPDGGQFANIKSGNTLFVPLSKYGHTAVITDYDPTTGDISVIERNRNSDGKTTTGTYNVVEMQKKYKEWGIADTSWNPKVTTKSAKGDYTGDKQAMFDLFKTTLIGNLGVGVSNDDREFMIDTMKTAIENNDMDEAKRQIRMGVLGKGKIGEQYEERETLVQLLNRSENQLNALKQSGIDTNLFTGSLEKIVQNLGETTNPKLAELRGTFDTILVDYIKSTSGTAVTDNERKMLAKILSDISNSPELSLSKLRNFRTNLEIKRDVPLKIKLGKAKFDKLFGGDYGSYIGREEVNSTTATKGDEIDTFLNSIQ